MKFMKIEAILVDAFLSFQKERAIFCGSKTSSEESLF